MRLLDNILYNAIIEDKTQVWISRNSIGHYRRFDYPETYKNGFITFSVTKTNGM
jgi:hypothetical protein